MNFKTIAYMTLLVSSASLMAEPAKPLTTEQLLTEQAVAGCGYWMEREVEVCDERTIYVDEPYKQCNYTRTYTTTPSAFPSTYSISQAVNGTCQQSLTHGVPNYTPHAHYALTSEEIKTRQVARTERYNCRTELRWVWIPGRPGGACQLPLSKPAI